MEVSLRESTVLKPATEMPRQSLWISNLDMISPNIHTPFVYIFRPNQHGSINAAANSNDIFFFNPRVLKEALCKVLVPFYPLAGRLRRRNNCIEINCNAEGVLFVVAECSFQANDLANNKATLEFGSRLIPAVDYSAGISSFPLFVVQVTYLKCGGVAVGIGFEHTLADAFSIFHFLKSWSEMARGIDDLSLLPHLDRTLLRARVPPRPLHEHNHRVEYHPLPPVTKSAAAVSVTSAVFNVTKEQINMLKAKSLMTTNSSVKYTSYEIFAAHVWRCACKARQLPDDQETQFHIPTTGRTRLQPPLPLGYFGNVIFWCAPTALVGDIVSNPINYTADCIHKALERMDDDEYLRSTLDYLELQKTHHDLSTIARGADHYKSPNLGMNSWVRVPIYDVDFGWGRPVFMGRGGLPDEGKAYMVPNASEDGSFSLAISLQSPHMKSFSKLMAEALEGLSK